MVIREVQDRDFVQLAEMRWTHAVEDDETYGEHNTDGVTKSVFIEEFVAFLYKIGRASCRERVSSPV